MRVLKRNGELEDFNFEKVRKVIEYACPSQDHVEKFISQLQLQLKDKMTTREVQFALIKLAEENIRVATPEYDSIASKLYTYNLIKEAGINRGYKEFGYGDFFTFVKLMTNLGLYGVEIMTSYSKEEIIELGSYIKPERDHLLTYVGVTSLHKRYLANGKSDEVYELPQEAFMAVAMFNASVEHPFDRVKYAKQFYDEMSLLNGTVATPTMANSRKPNTQLSSCFIGTVDDSLESIMNVGDMFAQVSKNGGGFGCYVGKIRAMNSDIQGFKNRSGGQTPWIKIYNDIAIAVDQLKIRKGAININNDVWHRDIFEFLQLRINTGDDRRKAHDVFMTLSVPDVFYQVMKKKGEFYLFCPHEIRTVKGWSLEDFYDDGVNNEFTKRYWECVNDDRIPKVAVKALDIWKEVIRARTETGMPFIFNRDTVNRANPNKHLGMIYGTNLCVEITQNMSAQGEVTRVRITQNGKTYTVETREDGDFVVCNLATLNLGKVHTEKDIERSVTTFVRMMDNVITLNEDRLPVEVAKTTNSKYRAIGLGTGGYHHMLALNNVIWETDAHLEFTDRIYEIIAFYAIKASMELAKEKGTYPAFEGSDWHTGAYFDQRGYSTASSKAGLDWDWLKAEVMLHGLRNGYLMAVAPNGSSSHYGGYTQSIDPIFDLVFIDDKKGQSIPVIAPDLDKVNALLLYKPAHRINQDWSVRANAIRQRHIDQSQSFNMYIKPDTTAVEIIKRDILAWELGVKTIYYTRSLSDVLEENTFDDDCVFCQA